MLLITKIVARNDHLATRTQLQAYYFTQCKYFRCNYSRTPVIDALSSKDPICVTYKSKSLHKYFSVMGLAVASLVAQTVKNPPAMQETRV